MLCPLIFFYSNLTVVSVPVWKKMLSVFENYAINYIIKSIMFIAFCLSSLYTYVGINLFCLNTIQVWKQYIFAFF